MLLSTETQNEMFIHNLNGDKFLVGMNYVLHNKYCLAP